MRHITTTIAAMAVLGLSSGLASAQGQGNGPSGNDKGREQASNGPKQDRGTESSQPSQADPENAGASGRGDDNRPDGSRASDRAQANDGASPMRDKAPAAAANATSGAGRSDNDARSRGVSAADGNMRSNAPTELSEAGSLREGRGSTRFNSRRDEAGDRPTTRRSVSKRDPFKFVQSAYFIEGCPLGLAKKNNNCLPPGQERQRPLLDYGADFFGYRDLQNARYRYGDGYLYRFNDTGNLLGYVPLLAGALSIGNPWPRSYQRNQVPDYFAEYYNLGPPRNYGYANDVIYRLNPESSAITSIAALLTGDEFRVGERAPEGYDIYNVPVTYRDQYRDTPNAAYRYSDGYVYEIDPATQLVRAAIELLA